MNNHLLIPDWEIEGTIKNIPHEALINKGIKSLILDVDGTLIPGKGILLNKEIKEWIIEAKKTLYIHLLSNNPSRKRIKGVAEQIKLDYTFGAEKPRRKSILKVINNNQISPSKTALIGDRIFTDVLAGNRLGLYTILVKPVNIHGEYKNSNKVQMIERSIANLLGAKRQ